MAFIARRGIALASARGPIPNVAEAVAGERIRGSWWAHRRGSDIFRALSLLGDSPDVLSFRLVEGKITFVHRRLWPALVRLVDDLGKSALTAIHQEHTSSGAHRNVRTPFPKWVSTDVQKAARQLTVAQAQAKLGAWVQGEQSR